MKSVKTKALAMMMAVMMVFAMAPLSVGAAFAKADTVKYLDENGVTQTITDYTVVDESTLDWDNGWYVVKDDVTINNSGDGTDKRIHVNGNDVKLILCDGAVLTAQEGITINESEGLTIYAQSTGDNAGKIVADCSAHGSMYTAIGGMDQPIGTLTINGGNIRALGGSGAAGIGGYGNSDGTSNGKSITINGGVIYAKGGEATPKDMGGVGIGGWYYGGEITINGGNVTAIGDYDCGYDGHNGIGIGAISKHDCVLTLDYDPKNPVFSLYTTHANCDIVLKKMFQDQDGYIFESADYTSFYEDTITPYLGKSITDMKIVLSKTSFTFDNKAHIPTVKTVGGMKLVEGKDYELFVINASHGNVLESPPVRAKKYGVYLEGKGEYTGRTATAYYTINKAANPLKLKGLTATVKYTKVKKAAQKLLRSKVIKLVNAGKGTKTYTKTGGNAKITISKTTGNVTIKKGLKKGTYKVKVKVYAKGTINYKAGSRFVTFTVVVK